MVQGAYMTFSILDPKHVIATGLTRREVKWLCARHPSWVYCTDAQAQRIWQEQIAQRNGTGEATTLFSA